MQLAGRQDAIEALGIRVAGMTYDDVAVLARFTAENRLSFPLLSDAGGAHARAFGILNEAYAPGHQAYGIPHPGIVWIDARGIVRAKFARPDYRERPDLDDVLAALRAGVTGAGQDAARDGPP